MIRPALAALALLLAATLPGLASQARIKDLVEFDGVRGNDLVGYGLVVGLNGTGDGLRNSPFTEEAMVNLLERLGINVTGEQFRARNVDLADTLGQQEQVLLVGVMLAVTAKDLTDMRDRTEVQRVVEAQDLELRALRQELTVNELARARIRVGYAR